MSKKFSVLVVIIYFLTTTFSISHAKESDSGHFGYGKTYVGLQAGWGKAFSLGIAGQGDGRNAEYLAILPQLGIGLTDVLGEDSWYKGNLDAVFQGEFLQAYEPNSGYSAGFSFATLQSFVFPTMGAIL